MVTIASMGVAPALLVAATLATGAGLLASGWSNASGRRRRVYKLTRRGRRQLDARKSEWRDFARAVDAVLA